MKYVYFIGDSNSFEINAFGKFKSVYILVISCSFLVMGRRKPTKKDLFCSLVGSQMAEIEYLNSRLKEIKYKLPLFHAIIFCSHMQ